MPPRRKYEPLEMRAARAGERAGRAAAEAHQSGARRTREAVRGHPSTAARRRFGATTDTAPADTAPAHAAGLFGETPPISETGLAGGQRGGQGSRGGGRRQQAAQRAQQAAIREVTAPVRGASRVLIMEFLVCLVLIALKPTEPAPSDQTGASHSIVPQIAATMVVFFLLAATGSASARAQKFTNAFGALITLALAFRNHGAVVASITSVTSHTTPATPAGAPSATGAAGEGTVYAPTPEGQAAAAQQAQYQQLLGSGWRGSTPTTVSPSGNAG